MFRGTTKDGREVFGWLVYDNEMGKAYIIDGYQYHYGVKRTIAIIDNEAIPSTIAMKTGQTDKHGTDIYSSFELKGEMTEGGDRLIDEAGDVYKIQYHSDWCAFVGVNELGDVLMMEDLEDTQIIKGE